MRRGSARTWIGLSALALAGLLTVGMLAFGAHGGGDDEHAGHTTTSAHGAHPAAGNFVPDQTVLADCPGDDANRCYEQAFGNLAYYTGPKHAIEEFDATMASDAAVKGNCHRIVHMIGSASLARFEGNVAKAFAAGSATCWSGYYHGILERSFAGAKSPAEVKTAARTICDSDEIEKTTFLLYQCVHGLGHGLMIYSGYDLPWALEVCDALATGWDQSSCSGGVFMENISSSYGITSKWVRDDDPVYPCRDMKQRHKLYCYWMVTSRINELNGFDWADTAATCEAVEREWVTTCFESYGRDASGWSVESPPKIKELCAIAASHVKECVYGAVRDLASYDPSGKLAAELCGIVEDRFRPRCWNGAGTIQGSIYATDAEMTQACRRLAPAAYRRDCLDGAGV
jgi:hypothetical protein